MKFCMMVPNICGSSICNLLHITLLSPVILRWLPGFGKFVHPWFWRVVGCDLSDRDHLLHVSCRLHSRCNQWHVLFSFPRKLAGHTVFITGASRGIGKAIALKVAKDGANVVIAAKTAETHPKLPGTIYTAAKEGTHWFDSIIYKYGTPKYHSVGFDTCLILRRSQITHVFMVFLNLFNEVLEYWFYNSPAYRLVLNS